MDWDYLFIRKNMKNKNKRCYLFKFVKIYEKESIKLDLVLYMRSSNIELIKQYTQKHFKISTIFYSKVIPNCFIVVGEYCNSK